MAGDPPPHLSLCPVDSDPNATVRRLAGAAGCEARTGGGLHHMREIAFAGRRWELRVSAREADLPRAAPATPGCSRWWGCSARRCWSALLLVVTGRARIETAVRERTAALQAEAHERERAQAALRDSEQRFRNILNTAPIGILHTDLRGYVKQANPRFCELTGYAEDELQLMTVAQYTHPDDVEADQDLSRRLVLASCRCTGARSATSPRTGARCGCSRP